ncbi:MAG: hypothetical protein EOO74_08785 [Myxococcales bacterium]|nr:MAG: hypothetical protein EOO74_08785 [Myxococcales bacterium]
MPRVIDRGSHLEVRRVRGVAEPVSVTISIGTVGTRPVVPSFTIAEAEEALMLPPGSLSSPEPVRVVAVQTEPVPATPVPGEPDPASVAGKVLAMVRKSRARAAAWSRSSV